MDETKSGSTRGPDQALYPLHERSLLAILIKFNRLLQTRFRSGVPIGYRTFRTRGHNRDFWPSLTDFYRRGLHRALYLPDESVEKSRTGISPDFSPDRRRYCTFHTRGPDEEFFVNFPDLSPNQALYLPHESVEKSRLKIINFKKIDTIVA